MHLASWLTNLPLDAATIGYAILVGVVTPWSAARSTRRIGRVTPANRSGLYRRLILSQVLLLALAMLVAVTHGANLFALPSTGWASTFAWSCTGLVLIAVALRTSWHTRSLENKQSMWVRGFLPSHGQLPTWIALAVVAAMAEEATYRGLFFGIIATASGSIALAVVASAVVFGAAHHIQGARSQLTIGVVSLALQGIVVMTGSLVPAMVVHAASNIIAGTRGAARFRAVEDSTPA